MKLPGKICQQFAFYNLVHNHWVGDFIYSDPLLLLNSAQQSKTLPVLPCFGCAEVRSFSFQVLHMGSETFLVEKGKRRELQCSVLCSVAVVIFGEGNCTAQFSLFLGLLCAWGLNWLCVLKRKACLMAAHLSVGHWVLLRLLLSGAEAATYGKIQPGIYIMSVCPTETQGI